AAGFFLAHGAGVCPRRPVGLSEDVAAAGRAQPRAARAQSSVGRVLAVAHRGRAVRDGVGAAAGTPTPGMADPRLRGQPPAGTDAIRGGYLPLPPGPSDVPADAGRLRATPHFAPSATSTR